MNPGSTSIERQPDTHAPHWIQAIVWVTSTTASSGTMYSRSGGGPEGRSQGVTRWIFFQWTASMSTIRSLITGMLPMGSTTIVPSCAWLDSSASDRWVLHASAARPLIFTPHEPQMAARHEQRMPTVPSCSARTLRMPSSTERCSSRSTLKSSQYAASPDSGRKRRIFSVNSGIGLVRPLLGLPLGDRHRGVAELGLVPVAGDVDVLEPVLVVALGVVG